MNQLASLHGLFFSIGIVTHSQRNMKYKIPSCDPDIATQNFVPCFAYGPAYQYLNQGNDDECNWNINYNYLGPLLTKTTDCSGFLDSSACENHYLSTNCPVEITGSDIYYPQCMWHNNQCIRGDDLTYISEANTSNLCFIFSCMDDSDCGTGSPKQTCVDKNSVGRGKCMIDSSGGGGGGGTGEGQIEKN